MPVDPVFHQIWEVCSCFSLKIISVSLSLLSPGNCNTYVGMFSSVSQVSQARYIFLHLFLCLLLRLVNFTCPVFRFTDYFFCLNSFNEYFNCFSVAGFYLLLLNNFCLCINILFLVSHCSLGYFFGFLPWFALAL